MQSLKVFGAAAVFAVIASSSAFAAAPGPFRAEATLAAPVSAPSEAVISGVNWKCDGDKCVGVAERYSSLDNPMRECRKVAAVVGPLAGYATRGRVMTKGNVNACNTVAAAKAGESVAAQK